MRRIALMFAVFSLASVSVVGHQTASPPSITAVSLLDRYDHGDREAVANLLSKLPESAFEPLARDFEHVAEPWTHAKDPGAAPRRRLVAATLALELAQAGLATEWQALRSSIELGCKLVRQNHPSELEHLWQLASMALYGGARDGFYLSKHLEHAKAQFSDEPRFRLEQAIVTEFPAAFDARRRDNPWIADADLLLQMGPFLGRFELERRDQIRAAMREFDDLRGMLPIRGEVELRIGHLMLLLHGDPLAERAIPFFQDAARESDDPFVRYLAFVFTGQALDMLHRSIDAEGAYRQALAIIPHVQSGVEALATHLFLDGKPDEAYAIVQAAFETQPRPPDVWRLYGFGDYVRWPELIRRLRAELR